MLHVKLTAGSAEAIDLQSLIVHSSGTGNDMAELGAVVLWRDADANGLADVGETQVGHMR